MDIYGNKKHTNITWHKARAVAVRHMSVFMLTQDPEANSMK